jgi:hypothetical protein
MDVMRVCHDLRPWTLSCFGMLVSDAFYGHSLAQAVGGWRAWAAFASWTPEEIAIFATTAPQAVVRVLVLLDINVKPVNPEKKSE